jgi:hypothetical protein
LRGEYQDPGPAGGMIGSILFAVILLVIAAKAAQR